MEEGSPSASGGAPTASPWRTVRFFHTHPPQTWTAPRGTVCCTVGHRHLLSGDVSGGITVTDLEDMRVVGQFSAYHGAVTHLRFHEAHRLLLTLGEEDRHRGLLRLWRMEAATWWRQPTATTTDPPPGPSRPPFQEHRLVETAAETSWVVSLGLEAAVATACRGLDVSDDLRHAAVAWTSDACGVLHGDVQTRRVHHRRLRSAHAKGRLTAVVFPPTALVRRLAGAAASGDLAAPTFLPAWAGPWTRAAEPLVQVLYTVYEDVVTYWCITAAGGYEEFLSPAPFGARPHQACLTAEGQLLVLDPASPRVALLGGDVSPKDDGDASNHKEEDNASREAALRSRTWWGTVRAIIAVEAGHTRRLLSHRGYLVRLATTTATSAEGTVQCLDLAHRLRVWGPRPPVVAGDAWLAAGPDDLLLGLPASQTVMRLTEVTAATRVALLLGKSCFDIALRVARAGCGASSAAEATVHERYGDHLYARGQYEAAMAQYIQTIGHLEPSYVLRPFLAAPHLPLLTAYLEALHAPRAVPVVTVGHTTLLLSCYVRLGAAGRLLDWVRRTDVRFDAASAIAVCRAGGYDAAALHLADAHAAFETYVRVLLEDLGRPREALDYLARLGVETAEGILRAVGRDLLRREPRRTTALLVTLCVHWTGPARRRRTSAPAAPPHRGRVADARALLVDAPACLRVFLRAVWAAGVVEAPPPPDLLHTLLELDLARRLAPSLGPPGETAETAVGEGCPVAPLADRQAEALALLTTYAGHYDDGVALELAHRNGWEEGRRWLLRRLRVSSAVCRLYTPRDAAMAAEAGGWIGPLAQLAADPATTTTAVTRALAEVEADHGLAPVTVMEAMEGPLHHLPLSRVREYVGEAMARAAERARAAQATWQTRRDTVEALQAEAQRLDTRAMDFPQTTCGLCHAALEAPAVYVRCGHVFHEACLAGDCPLCPSPPPPPSGERVDLPAFLSDVQRTAGSTRRDVVTVVAAYVGRGLLETAAVRREAATAAMYDVHGDALRPEAVERW